MSARDDGTLYIRVVDGEPPMFMVLGEDTSWLRLDRHGKNTGQRLASERENLIALGINPNDLEIPL